jgi:alkylhydroperoxidase/carboxymuconolactone decarboxylase family protein YurZ
MSITVNLRYKGKDGAAKRFAEEMAAVITHVAFYAGWPKAWAVFNLAKEVYE